MNSIIQQTTLNVSNETFLKAIFGDDYARAHVTDFVDDPMNITTDRRGPCWAGNWFERYYFDVGRSNQYFTISIFNPEGWQPETKDDLAMIKPGEQTLRPVRRKANFKYTLCIVVDDVKDKVPEEQAKLLPATSWRLETSPGNEQWGYILDVPCDDINRVTNLLDGLVAKGLAPDGKDPGMKGVTRYVRLPEGWNSKANNVDADGNPYKCQMVEWNPAHKVTMESLAEPFDIDLDAPCRNNDGSDPISVEDANHPVLQRVQVLKNHGGGKYDIVCPRHEEHNGGDTSGTAIWTHEDGTAGIKCYHGHGDDIGWPQLKEKLGITFADTISYHLGRVFGGDYIRMQPLPVNELGVVQMPLTLLQQAINDAVDVCHAIKPPAEVAVKTSDFKLITIADVMKAMGPINWMVNGIIPEGTISQLVGPSGEYKTFVAVDIACCIASGSDWHGHRVANQGFVVYVAGEGNQFLARRFKAWCIANGYDEDDLNMVISTRSTQLTQEESVAEVINKITEIVRQKGEVPSLVIIDTLARNFGGADENSTQDMNLLVRHSEDIMSVFTDTSLLFIHHTGHSNGERGRGSSVFPAAVDVTFNVKADTGAVNFSCSKMKDAPAPEAKVFYPKVVEIGFKEYDDTDATSVVLSDDGGNCKATRHTKFYNDYPSLGNRTRKEFMPALIICLYENPSATFASIAKLIDVKSTTVKDAVKELKNCKLVTGDNKLTEAGIVALRALSDKPAHQMIGINIPEMKPVVVLEADNVTFI